MKIFSYTVPVVIALILIIAAFKKVNIIEEFTAGAVDGFKVVYGLAPILILMLTALAMFKSSGVVDMLAAACAPVFEWIGIPGELLPLAIMRPLSGSGSIALVSQYLGDYGPDSLIGRIACVMAASTETTLYTITIYMGAARTKKIGPALIAGLTADFCAFIIAALTVRLLL